MSFIVYKIEDNLDSYFWDGKEWNNKFEKRKIFESKKEANAVAKNNKGKCFNRTDPIKCRKDYADKNVLLYHSMEELWKLSRKRVTLKREDCTFLGSSRELESEIWKRREI